MQVWNLLHAARWKHRTQKVANNRHLGTVAQLCRAISSQLRHVKNKSVFGKNLLGSNMSSTCPHNMVNFGSPAAEIDPVVWGTPANFNGFRVFWQRYCTASSSGRQPNFAALNRGRHLGSAGRPSRWALAHILLSLWNAGYKIDRKLKLYEAKSKVVKYPNNVKYNRTVGDWTLIKINN